MPPARPGMEKSFALRCFAKSLNPNLYHMEYICLSTISVAEFYIVDRDPLPQSLRLPQYTAIHKGIPAWQTT